MNPGRSFASTIRRRLAACAGSLVCVAACADSVATVELDFPSLDYVRISSSAEVLAYDASSGSRCAELVVMARGGGVVGEPAATTFSAPICEFRAGGETISGLDPGEYDFLVIARGGDSTVLVVGCTHARFDRDSSGISVRVANLSPAGIAALTALEPSDCSGLESYCEGGCP